MAEDDKGPLAQELRRLMVAADNVGQKRLAEEASALIAGGVSETYIRDILKGKSRNPQASKLRAVTEALQRRGVDAAHLLGLASTPEAGEFVRDPAELFLLHTWRKLPKEERKDVGSYIDFRLAKALQAPTRKPDDAA